MTTRILDFTSVANDNPHLPSDSVQGAFFTSLDADAEVFTEELYGSVSTWRCDDTLPNTFTVAMFLPQINSNSRGHVLLDASGNGIGFLIRDYDIRVFEYVGNFLTGGALATYSASVVTNDTITIEANQSSGAYVIKQNGVTVATYNQAGLSGLFAGFTLRGGTFRTWTLSYTSGAQVDTYSATVRSGSTGNAYTTTGLSDVSGITIGSLAATSISDASGDGTHSVPSLTDGVTHELYGTKTVTVTGTEGAPTTSTSFQPLVTQNFVTLSGTLNTTETGGLYNFSPAAVVTDQIVFPSAGITYDAQGNITGEAGTYNCWHIQASTKIARSYTVTLGEVITPPSEPPSIDKRFIMEFIAANAKASQALGYQQITNLSTAIGLTIPKGTSYILFKPNAQAIRFRDDGTNPTTSIGYPVAAGAEYIYTGNSPSELRFIQTATSATLDVLYYGVA